MIAFRNNNQSRVSENAYTIVELLISVAITLLLAGLLIPAIKDSTNKAKGAVCASNLKQMGVAFILYAADNDGSLPPYASDPYNPPSSIGLTALALIAPYIGKSSSNTIGQDCLRCPSNPGSLRTYGVNYPYVFGYTNLNQGGSSRLIKLNSKVFLAACAWSSVIFHPEGGHPFTITSVSDSIINQRNAMLCNNLCPIHEKGVNALFGDMHVARVPIMDFINPSVDGLGYLNTLWSGGVGGYGYH